MTRSCRIEIEISTLLLRYRIFYCSWWGLSAYVAAPHLQICCHTFLLSVHAIIMNDLTLSGVAIACHRLHHWQIMAPIVSILLLVFGQMLTKLPRLLFLLVSPMSCLIWWIAPLWCESELIYFWIILTLQLCDTGWATEVHHALRLVFRSSGSRSSTWGPLNSCGSGWRVFSLAQDDLRDVIVHQRFVVEVLCVLFILLCF